MRVRVLGGLSVDDVPEKDLGSRKARTLLKVLAVARGAPVSVERLVDILWGDDAPARPADQIGVLVSRLRGVLGSDRLVRTDAGIALRADWFDVAELEARVREAGEALAADRLGACRAAAGAALALVRGRVLPEEDGEWVDVDRATVDAMAASARRMAAEAAARAGDHLAAVAAAEEALAHDPYDEAALRVLMRAHVTAGRPASALAAYVRVRDRLVEDLGVSPTAQTEALHDAVVLGGGDEAPVAPAETATLPGRADALRALDAALALAAASTSPVAVAVVGERGIGKTALVEHWCRALVGRAVHLVGRCDPLGRDLPLQPLADAVASRLAGCTHDDRVAALGADADVLAPLLGIDTSERRPAVVVMDNDMGRARLFTALLGVVGRLADDRVPVVVVDDVHLAGDSTLAWLRYAARRPGRLLLVTTGPAGRDPLLDNAATVELGPLDVDATAAVVGADRAAALHARSGGHPLLLAALAAAGDSAEASTIHDAIVRRISALGDGAVTVRTAAVLGTNVDLDLLADVLRLPAAELLEHLEAAVAAGLLVERGPGFAFRHELEREVLDASMGEARRALVHRDAARALVERGAVDPLVVAAHARRGGDVDVAVDCYTQAAAVALGRYDTAVADSLLEEAFSLGEAPAAFTTRARLRMATARFEEAAEDARRAVAGGAGAEALEVAGWIAYYRRRYDEALAFADGAAERAVDPAVQVSSLALAGRVRHGAGALVEAAVDLERAVKTPAPPEVRALAAVWLAQARVHQGRPGDALQLLDRALVDPERLGHVFAPLHAGFTRALALGQLGRADDALRACDELDRLVARSAEAGERMVGPAGNTRAWLLRWTGRSAEADDLNEAIVATHDPSGPRAEAHYAGMLDLADGRLLADDDGGAAELVECMADVATWDGTMSWHQRHRWNLLRARLALRDGDRDGALALCEEVANDAASRGARRYELLACAVGALAGGSVGAEEARLDEVIVGLRQCAALDGRHLVDALSGLRTP